MLQLSVDGEVLTIGVEKSKAEVEQGEKVAGKYHRLERSQAFQRRAMRMPESACLDEDKIAATYENGVLCVTFPKTDVHPAAKHIEIA